MRKKRHYLTDEDIRRIRVLIEQERLQQWKVAEAVGVHTGTIERICKRLKLKTVHCGSRTGPESAHWKGGRVKYKGYWHVRLPGHPCARKSGYVSEHRLVMEKKLGRYLLPTEVVHHIDGDQENNLAENLMVFQTNAAHLKHELKGKVPQWTPEGKEAIRRAVLKSANSRQLKHGGGQHPQSIGRLKVQSGSIGEDPRAS